MVLRAGDQRKRQQKRGRPTHESSLNIAATGTPGVARSSEFAGLRVITEQSSLLSWSGRRSASRGRRCRRHARRQSASASRSRSCCAGRCVRCSPHPVIAPGCDTPASSSPATHHPASASTTSSMAKKTRRAASRKPAYVDTSALIASSTNRTRIIRCFAACSPTRRH